MSDQIPEVTDECRRDADNIMAALAAKVADAPAKSVASGYYAGMHETLAHLSAAHRDLKESQSLLRQQAAELEQVKEERDSYIEREASVCPEDVGFVELIGTLRKELEQVKAQLQEREQTIAALQSRATGDEQAKTVFSAEDVCAMIDAFPNVNPAVAAVLKLCVRKGELPHAVKQSLKLRAVVMFERIPSTPQGSEKEGSRGPNSA